MELGFHVPIFDIDGGVTAIAGLDKPVFTYLSLLCLDASFAW
jgi:hypothetical protein